MSSCNTFSKDEFLTLSIVSRLALAVKGGFGAEHITVLSVLMKMLYPGGMGRLAFIQRARSDCTIGVLESVPRFLLNWKAGIVNPEGYYLFVCVQMRTSRSE